MVKTLGCPVTSQNWDEKIMVGKGDALEKEGGEGEGKEEGWGEREVYRNRNGEEKRTDE